MKIFLGILFLLFCFGNLVLQKENRKNMKIVVRKIVKGG